MSGDISPPPGMPSRAPRLAARVPVQPDDRANLDDQLYERLKAMIIDGTLLPGERIVPDQLARDMGVSRTPMLSALKRLSQEHVITWHSRRGVFVRRLSKRELAMVFEVREVLEGLAARRAAMLIKPRQVEQLRALFAAIDTADTPANRRAYLRQDYLFHSGILAIAASTPLTQTTQSVNILVLAFGAGLIKSIHDGLTEHAAILDALRRHDPDGAEAAMPGPCAPIGGLAAPRGRPFRERERTGAGTEFAPPTTATDRDASPGRRPPQAKVPTTSGRVTMNDRNETSDRPSVTSPISRRGLLQQAAVGAALPALMSAALAPPARAQGKQLPTLGGRHPGRRYAHP